MSPDEIRDVLQELGYKAKIERSDDSPTAILSAAEGIEFSLVFFPPMIPDGEIDGYDSILFSACLLADDEISLDTINNINSETRFFRVYRDDEDHKFAFIELDTFVYPERFDKRMFEDLLALWIAFMPDIVKQLDI